MDQKVWLQRCVTVILRSRWPALVIVSVLTVLAAFFARKITIDTSLEAWFLEDSETIVTYKEFRRQFGEDEFIVLAIEADDIFAPQVLGLLKQLTEVAQDTHHVHRSTSLTNVDVLRRNRRSVRSGPLMKQLPTTLEESSRLREVASTYPLIHGSLVSKDGRAAAIVVQLARECNTFAEKAEVARALEAAFREHASELDPSSAVTVRIAGSPVLSEAVSRHIREDMEVLTPTCFAVVIVATLLLFRRISVPVICLAVVGLAVVWVLGVMGGLEIKMNLLGPVLTTIIMVVGVADSVHIFSAYFQELDQTANEREALHRALSHVLIPCVITSLTTVIGFLSLLTSNLEPIRHFGALAALGTVFALAISIFLIPAVLQCVPVRVGNARRPAAHTAMDRVLALIGHPTRRVSGLVLAASSVIVILGALAIPRIEITASPMNYFRPEDPVRRDAEAIDAALGGTANIEFIVHAPNGGLKDRDVLRRLDEFEVWLETLPGVERVMSFGALLKEVDRVRNRKGQQPGELPRSGLALLFAKNIMQNSVPELLGEHVQDDYSLGRISARVHAANADKLVALAPDIERWVRNKVNGPDLEIQATGFVKLMEDMRSYLIRSQVISVMLAFGMITLTLLVLFRSWKLALFSMIPNVGPIIMGLGFMAVRRIRLDPGTVMIATIALGLVVDDTCHFLVRLRQRIRVGDTLDAAVAETMRQTGRPIILTSFILALGFGSLLFGGFTTTRSFGEVCAFVLLTALVADLVVLPAALLILRPKV